MPSRPSSRTLLKILKSNQGRLGNSKARNLLIEDFGAHVSSEDYEHIKNKLLSTGSIRKGSGRGGSIVLIDDTPQSPEWLDNGKHSPFYNKLKLTFDKNMSGKVWTHQIALLYYDLNFLN